MSVTAASWRVGMVAGPRVTLFSPEQAAPVGAGDVLSSFSTLGGDVGNTNAVIEVIGAVVSFPGGAPTRVELR